MSSCRHLDGGFKVLRLGKAKQVWTAAGRRDPLELACLPHRGYASVNSLELWGPSWAVPNFSRMGYSWLASRDTFLLLLSWPQKLLREWLTDRRLSLDLLSVA